MTRNRLRRACPMIWRSRSAPMAPISLNPAETTMAAWTPASTHSAITSGTVGAGVATMARSIGSGTSPMRGWALIPRTRGRFGLTGKTVPPNGLVIRFHTRVRPMLRALSDAPMTATLWGVKNACRPPPLAPSKSVATFFSEDSPLAVLIGHFPIHIPGETVRFGIVHRKADRIIGFVDQADVGHRPIGSISGERTQSQPGSSPRTRGDPAEAIPRKVRPAREFRSPTFQPVGLPIRTEFRVGWRQRGVRRSGPGPTKRWISGTRGVPQPSAPTPRREHRN